MAGSTLALEREPSLEHYMQGRHIGAGGQGRVYGYTHKPTGQLLAVKVLEWRPDKLNSLYIIQEAFVSLHTDHVSPTYSTGKQWI